MLSDHSKLYQLRKFFYASPKASKDIIIAMDTSDNMGNNVQYSVNFCSSLMENLFFSEKGEYLNTKICLYQYWQTSPSLILNWTSNETTIKQSITCITLYFNEFLLNS